DVVAVVAVRRRLKRREPQDVDAERLEIVEPLHQAVKVTAAVRVPIHERLQVEAVDDRVLVPKVGDHGAAPREHGILRNSPAPRLVAWVVGTTTRCGSYRGVTTAIGWMLAGAAIAMLCFMLTHRRLTPYLHLQLDDLQPLQDGLQALAGLTGGA